MRISALITTYRRFDKCCRAIDAILRQTLPAAEIVVVDNGSPEPEYLKLHDRYADASVPVTVVRLSRGTHTLPPLTNDQGHEIDLACRDTTNVAIGLARGDWLAFCHDDDEWMPHRLEVQAAAVQKHATDLIGCNIYNRSADGYVGEVHHSFHGPHGTPIGDGVTDVTGCLTRFNPLAVSGLLVSRTVIATVGGWQHWVPDPVGKYMRSLAASDWDFYRRAASMTPLLRVDEPLVWYEIGNVKHEGHMSYA
jgi:glycosyltransferase involved in cell wall biosynthesis